MGGIDLLNFLTKTSPAFGPDTGSCILCPRTIFWVVNAWLLLIQDCRTLEKQRLKGRHSEAQLTPSSRSMLQSIIGERSLGPNIKDTRLIFTGLCEIFKEKIGRKKRSVLFYRWVTKFKHVKQPVFLCTLFYILKMTNNLSQGVGARERGDKEFFKIIYFNDTNLREHTSRAVHHPTWRGGWRSGGLKGHGDRTGGLQGGARSGTHGGAGSSGGHGGSWAGGLATWTAGGQERAADSSVNFPVDGGLEWAVDGGVNFPADGGLGRAADDGVNFPADGGLGRAANAGVNFSADGGLEAATNGGGEFPVDGGLKGAANGGLVLAQARTLPRHRKIPSLQLSPVVSGRSTGWW